MSARKLAAAAMILSIVGCRSLPPDPPAPPRPNIVFVLTDQWRAQATGYAGDPNVRTPNLDRLASQSIRFSNAVSVCPVCTPYRASLMTGRYPLSTGMFLNDLHLPAEELCMAEVFAAAGYETAYIGKWHLDGHGRDVFIPRERRQGFDYWKVLECTHRYNKSYYYAGDDETRLEWEGYDAYAQTADAQDYIRSHAQDERPFLLMVAYGGPHFPHHLAPQELKDLYPSEAIVLHSNVPQQKRRVARKESQGYYAHCTALDRCVGDLLATLEQTGALENTIFVFTSDHGEMLGSHGQPPRQKQRPWDESIRVPFLLLHPAACGREGREVAAPINTPDILPTLLSLAGIEAPSTIEGEDLSRLVLDPHAREDRAALFMIVSPFGAQKVGVFRGIRTSRYSYVRNSEGPWLLYDNLADPFQRNNLLDAADRAGLRERLEEQLQRELRRTGDEFRPAQHYRDAWGYEVGKGGSVPYFFLGDDGVGPPEGFRVQSPATRLE